ncbi:MAG: glycoside hydrolase family 32 protein [Acidobacteriota bacterium]
MPHEAFTRRTFARLCAAAGIAASRGAAAAEEPNPAIRKAMDAVRAGIAKAASDPDRPTYHFHPPAQWNNDPNGTIFYKGWHHLFYQHNPFEAKWGHMHWGHARSRDLVNWEHLPIALWPSLEKGEEHVFSGCAALAPDGRPRLLYTSIGKRDPEQWLAEPADDDLIVWRKSERNPVATVKLHGNRRVHDWRDPFVFVENGRTYMVTGGNNNGRSSGGASAVYLYEAAKPDLTEWKFLGPVFEYRNREIVNIECPNLFKLGSKWVLLISPHRPCEYFIGDLDLARRKFVPECCGVLDPGKSYASNISYDDQGRCILWLWGQTDTNPEKGWNSVMVMPRILTIGDDGYLRQNPAPEFERLRGKVVTAPPCDLGAAPVPLPVTGDSLEIQAVFTFAGARSVGLRLRSPGSGKGFRVGYGPRPGIGDGALLAGEAHTVLGFVKQLRLRVFLDKTVVEAYANDGTAAIFTPLGPGPHGLGIEAYAEGGAARLESFQAWPLKPASFSLDRYALAPVIS